MKRNVVVGLLVFLLTGSGTLIQTYAKAGSTDVRFEPFKGPKKAKRNFFKRKKKYRNSTVVRIKRSGKGPNQARRHYSNNFR